MCVQKRRAAQLGKKQLHLLLPPKVRAPLYFNNFFLSFHPLNSAQEGREDQKVLKDGKAELGAKNSCSE